MKPIHQWTIRELWLFPVIAWFLIVALACEMWHLICDHEFPDY